MIAWSTITSTGALDAKVMEPSYMVPGLGDRTNAMCLSSSSCCCCCPDTKSASGRPGSADDVSVSVKCTFLRVLASAN